MNIFEKHPKTTIVAVLAVCVVCVVVLIESLTLFPEQSASSERALRFREHVPGSEVFLNPADDVDLVRLSSPPKAGNYRISVDANGFIEPSAIHADPDFTVVFLGGSTTECAYNAEKKRFPYLAGRFLEKKAGKKVNSFNGGRSGNTSFNATLLLLGKVVPMKPDVVVLMECINDLSTLVLLGDYWSDHATRSTLLLRDRQNLNGKWMAFKHFLRQMMPNVYTMVALTKQKVFPGQVDEFAGNRRPMDSFPTDAILSNFQSSLEDFVCSARSWGIEPILMTQANRITPGGDDEIFDMVKRRYPGLDFDEFRSVYSAMNDEIRQVAKRNGVVLVDLEAIVPSTSEYIYDSVHLTDKGCELVASVVSDALIKRPSLQQ